jgi:hypothetical protein
MSGMVERTGQCGLLPANYVESIIIWYRAILQIIVAYSKEKCIGEQKLNINKVNVLDWRY